LPRSPPARARRRRPGHPRPSSGHPRATPRVRRMTPLGVVSRRTFGSLRVRNYRLYFIGQLVSNTGTWMQTVAQSWLVLQLTDSGSALGLTIGLQFLPLLLFGVWGGLIADRVNKRHALIATQATYAALALSLWTLV